MKKLQVRFSDMQLRNTARKVRNSKQILFRLISTSLIAIRHFRITLIKRKDILKNSLKERRKLKMKI